MRGKGTRWSVWILILGLVVVGFSVGCVCDDSFVSEEEEAFFDDSPEVPESPSDAKPNVRRGGSEGKPGRKKNMRAFQFKKYDNYYFEAFAASIIAVYLTFWWLGSKENDRIATAWGVAFRDLLSDNFVKIGDGRGVLLRDYPNIYTIFATGRRNCSYLIGSLNLVKRHDLFMKILGYMQPMKDSLSLSIALPDKVDPFVFAIVRRKDLKKYREEWDELRTGGVCRLLKNPPGMDSAYAILSEYECLIPEFVDADVLQVLKKHGDLFESLLVTDMNTRFPEGEKSILQLRLNLPSVDDMKRLSTLMRMLFFLIDKVVSARIPASILLQGAKRREEMKSSDDAEKKERLQEAAIQRRFDRQKEDDERIKKLPLEKQRKIEAKRQKEKARKLMPRMKTVQQ